MCLFIVPGNWSLDPGRAIKLIRGDGFCMAAAVLVGMDAFNPRENQPAKTARQLTRDALVVLRDNQELFVSWSANAQQPFAAQLAYAFENTAVIFSSSQCVDVADAMVFGMAIAINQAIEVIHPRSPTLQDGRREVCDVPGIDTSLPPVQVLYNGRQIGHYSAVVASGQILALPLPDVEKRINSTGRLTSPGMQ